MDKFKTFFSRIGLLNEPQFDELSRHAQFEIKLPTNKVGAPLKTTLNILLKSVPSSQLINTLYENIENIKDKLNVVFIGNPIPIDIHQLSSYILLFFKINGINNVLLNNLIQRENIAITDSGLVMITYDSKSEMKEFKFIEKTLLDFLRSINLFVTGFDYQANHDQKQLNAYKKVKEEEILATLRPTNVDELQLRRVIAYNQNIFINKYKDPITKISNIVYTGENQYLNVSGEIFKINVDILKNGAQKFVFYVSDYEDSIAITLFAGVKKAFNAYGADINLPFHYLKSFAKGDWVKARIRIDQNKYTNNEIQGLCNYITKVNKPKQFARDDLEHKTRIELLAHTNMSMFDGLIEPEKLVRRSKTYNWQAIGIADRFNVHAYPVVMNAAAKFRQKIAYGLECNVINRQIDIVINPHEQDLNNNEYVIFDIETTGLNNEYDEITEFGAIKVKNGMIIDEVDWFASISKPLSYKLQEKTHITNEMLMGQPNIKEILKRIVHFVGDATLIAHNAASFDIRFINKKLQQNNMPILTNTVIDTLLLSYAINTHLVRHNLGVVARDLKLNYDESTAHRANIDARVLYEVWLSMIHRLEKLDIKNINDINVKLQNDKLHHNQFGHFVVIYSRNQQGIKDIYKLVSHSHTKNLHRKPRVYIDEIKNNRANLIVTNHPTESDIWDIALNGSDEQLAMAMMFYDYIFVAPVNNLLHLIHREEINEQNVKKTINRIIEVANNVNKKVIAVSDAYYLDPNEKIAHDVYVHTKQGGGSSHRLYRYGDSNSVMPDMHLRTTKEMLNEFNFLKDEEKIREIVIDNTHLFINQIDGDIRPVKTGSFRPKLGDVSTKLRNLVNEQVNQMYDKKIPKIVNDRIEHELKMIIDNDYAIIYWSCYLLVKQTNEDGYIVGSRGSVGSSIVAYLSGISEVNPLKPHYYCKKCKNIDFNVSNHADGFDLPPQKCPICGAIMQGDGHNIPFETFLGFPGDPKVPDIDLNFPGEYQPKAHDFIRRLFGETRTFRAGTISTVAEKTAFGWVRNYFELTKPNEQPKNSTIEWIASKCMDVKRTTGQHPGGIIIVPQEYDILDFTPYNFPADNRDVNWYTTHFDYKKIHDNLLKFDILGHEDPTSLKMLEDITGIKIQDIPFHDDEVMKLYYSMDSLRIDPNLILGEKIGSFGLPEFGTQFVRSMLAVAQPKSFADLVRVCGLAHGTDVWKNNAEQLIVKQGMKLSEVITCRDDIMNYLIHVGINHEDAFKIMESVRKGKGLTSDWMSLMRKNGVSDWYINSCNKIKYLFPKAHATAYVMMSWRIAWFKIHHPLAFYAVYFSVRPDVSDLPTILKGPDAIRNKLHDVKTRLADFKTKGSVKAKEENLIPIYELALEMYARGYSFTNINLEKSDAFNYIVEGNTLIPPFKVLDGMGEQAANSIIQARNERPFSSKADLAARTKITKSILAAFNVMGVTNNLDEDNQLSLF
ncbi:MAG: PolC-type DNA polymerase III [Mycoplasmataceae bacterium]|nr:PolC-type DNA polymerase III [Mycoplasmataceae bacterium]